MRLELCVGESRLVAGAAWTDNDSWRVQGGSRLFVNDFLSLGKLGTR